MNIQILTILFTIELSLGGRDSHLAGEIALKLCPIFFTNNFNTHIAIGYVHQFVVLDHISYNLNNSILKLSKYSNGCVF